jgi:hypothetical protein
VTYFNVVLSSHFPFFLLFTSITTGKGEEAEGENILMSQIQWTKNEREREREIKREKGSHSTINMGSGAMSAPNQLITVLACCVPYSPV